MCGIGEATVGKRVAEQEITIFVVDAGNRNRKLAKDGQANKDDTEEENYDYKSLSLCESREWRFEGSKDFLHKSRKEKRKQHEGKADEDSEAKLRREACRQSVKEFPHRG
jgi:hypothetical protein